MDSKIVEFLDKEKICVLSVLMSDGSPHSATVHFSYEGEPLRFFIQTTNTTVKVKSLLNGQTAKASMVIGFSEKDWITFQMRGTAKIISDAGQLEELHKIHYKKQPEAERRKGPNTVFIEFT